MTGRALRIGLTGPIGCGKSTVAGWLAEDPGVVAIDADDVARDVLALGTPELAAVFARFGAGLRREDGSLDRAALGRVVFTDPAALRDLEAIVHPAVRPRIEARMAEADAAGAQVVVVEAVKLVEGGLASLCDEVWLVTCDPSVQLERVLTRGMDPADARTRVEAQGDLTDRLRPVATRILDTGPSPAAVRAATHAALAAALGGPASVARPRVERPPGPPDGGPDGREARRVSGAEICGGSRRGGLGLGARSDGCAG